jgi:hypothetical protein
MLLTVSCSMGETLPPVCTGRTTGKGVDSCLPSPQLPDRLRGLTLPPLQWAMGALSSRVKMEEV